MIRTCVPILFLLAAPLAAQPTPGHGPQQQNEAIPVAMALSDLSDAYGAAPTADEVTARVRMPGLERTEVFTVRIEPDPESPVLRQVLLELGQLRAYFGEGRMLVTSTAAADKYYMNEYEGELSAATVERLLPPLPAPQLILAAGVRAGEPVDLTPYTRGIVLDSAMANPRARQPVMVIGGAGAGGPVTLIADVHSARLVRFAADIAAPAGALSLDLTCRPVEAGDSSLWRPLVEGRKRARELSELRPAPLSLTELRAGEVVPDITLSSVDLVPWSLAATLAAESPRPVVLVMWRWSSNLGQRESTMRDARAAADALRALTRASSVPEFTTVSAVAMELSEYSRTWFEATASEWAGAAAQEPAAAFSGDQLLWTSAPSRTIKRLSPGSRAAAIVVDPQRRLQAVVPLDGRAGDEGLRRDLRAALSPPEQP
jgi:hypothetical protein